ncbi:LysR family transcriptional regulator [Streptomyces sp. MST-110588]|uniref:LysR family transcriptional regulator n=1 Tax=Streptomyces sp. MST-110588 TaxID=2833628 RepID=UPI001F5D8D6C|nr:LysR family transcriptional regulator [Streptomyces sp. MST-110588]UNO41771.1 LysR family transcriptional regulator [Streptomyces sp. MST-110588]
MNPAHAGTASGVRTTGGHDGVELRHLRAFVAVAEERSFTHAADRLGIGQPALTRTVRALEDALAVRLLDRTTRRVELTDAGRQLHDDIAPLLSRLADALRSPGEQAILRLGFTAPLPACCPALTSAFEAATGAGVRLVRRDTPLAGLDTGESDVAVLRGDPPEGAPVRTRLLSYESRVAVVSRTEPGTGPARERTGTVARRRVLDWAELADLPLVVNTVTGTTRPELWPRGRRPRLACTADNFDEWLEAVAAGHGIGVASEAVAQRHTHPGLRFVRLKNAPPVPVRLALPDRDAHPLAERFFRLTGPAAPAPENKRTAGPEQR